MLEVNIFAQHILYRQLTTDRPNCEEHTDSSTVMTSTLEGKVSLTIRGKQNTLLAPTPVHALYIMRRVSNVLRQVVLVTGGSNGIGAAIVSDFLSKGAKVASLDILPQTDSAPKNVLNLECDISSEESLKQAVDKIVSEWNQLDVLVNCAGVCKISTISTTPPIPRSLQDRSNPMAPTS